MIRPEIPEQERWLGQRVLRDRRRRMGKKRQLETISDLFLIMVGDKRHFWRPMTPLNMWPSQ